MTLYGILGSAFMAYVYLGGEQIQGRLTFGHPNYLGLISFGVLVCCLSFRNVIAKLLFVGFNMFIILEAQARACLLASVISIVVYTFLVGRGRGYGWLFYTGCTMVAALSIWLVYRQEVASWISATLFLDDRYRGLGTGFTGRLDAWHEAVELFRENPVFGVGFRAHERLMTALPSAHNGYLAMLAETGIVGLSCALALIGVCLRRVFRLALTGDRVAIVGFAFVCGYLFAANFDRFLVNYGSPTSVLMWIFLLMPRWPRPGVSIGAPEQSRC